MQLNSLQDVLVEQLADLYSAEQQLVQALPRVSSVSVYHRPKCSSPFATSRLRSPTEVRVGTS